MANPDKPLEYQRRIRDTKGVAQRLDLSYLRRATVLGIARRRLTWALVAAALLAGAPLVTGVGGSRKTIESGPLSESHALFEGRCEVCHLQAFGGVPDKACLQCHDAGPHPAKSLDVVPPNSKVRCVECHIDHRGRVRLAQVGNGNCTSCHANIAAHANCGLCIMNATAFRPGKHPEFSAAQFRDERPMRLNHAIHMPTAAKEILGIKLPMKCGDCHALDRYTGQFLPVAFEQNCKSCHARELEFDVDHVLGARSVPAPHAKDAKAIHEFIWKVYGAAVKADPSLTRSPVGNDLMAAPAWMERVVKDAEQYLFGRKCGYCHQTAGDGEVRKVGAISGRYDGAPWLPRGEFNHRSHRAVECESCHTSARTSTRTLDVLIPAMKTCTPCHGASSTRLDDCATCHLYHNRFLEKDRAPGGPLGRPLSQ
jgi:hypothetical protein